jgi:hypothetical protein
VEHHNKVYYQISAQYEQYKNSKNSKTEANPSNLISKLNIIYLQFQGEIFWGGM